MIHSAKRSSKSTGQRPKSTVTSGLLPTPTSGRATQEMSPSQKARHTKNLAQTIQLTSSPADSHASHLVPQDEEKERKMTVTSGLRCLESLKNSDRAGSSVRTLAALLLGTKGWYSNKCMLTWKLRDTKSKRLLFQLSPSTRRTEEIESGLSGGAQQIMLPTMRSSGRGGTKKGRDSVDSVIEMGARKGEAGTKTGLKLQPAFALWMMGYPTDWLDLKAGEMPLSKAQAMRSFRR